MLCEKQQFVYYTSSTLPSSNPKCFGMFGQQESFPLQNEPAVRPSLFLLSQNVHRKIYLRVQQLISILSI